MSPSMTHGAWALEHCFWKLETQAKALEEQAFHLQGVWTRSGQGGLISGHQEFLWP